MSIYRVNILVRLINDIRAFDKFSSHVIKSKSWVYSILSQRTCSHHKHCIKRCLNQEYINIPTGILKLEI